jgi:hypothetical protein
MLHFSCLRFITLKSEHLLTQSFHKLVFLLALTNYFAMCHQLGLTNSLQVVHSFKFPFSTFYIDLISLPHFPMICQSCFLNSSTTTVSNLPTPYSINSFLKFASNCNALCHRPQISLNRPEVVVVSLSHLSLHPSLSLSLTASLSLYQSSSLP